MSITNATLTFRRSYDRTSTAIRALDATPHRTAGCPECEGIATPSEDHSPACRARSARITEAAKAAYAEHLSATGAALIAAFEADGPVHLGPGRTPYTGGSVSMALGATAIDWQ